MHLGDIGSASRRPCSNGDLVQSYWSFDQQPGGWLVAMGRSILHLKAKHRFRFRRILIHGEVGDLDGAHRINESGASTNSRTSRLVGRHLCSCLLLLRGIYR